MKLMKKVILWLAKKEMERYGSVQYERGWYDGVVQERYESESVVHSTMLESKEKWRVE